MIKAQGLLRPQANTAEDVQVSILAENGGFDNGRPEARSRGPT